MFPHTDGIVEMFPHTGDIHNGVSGYVEVAVLLERVSNRKAASYVKLNVKADIMKFGCSGVQQSRQSAYCPNFPEQNIMSVLHWTWRRWI